VSKYKWSWSGAEYDPQSWRYHVVREHPRQFRLLGIVKRDLTESGPKLHHYVAFENVQHTNMIFPTLAEAKAWVVACTMGAKP